MVGVEGLVHTCRQNHGLVSIDKVLLCGHCVEYFPYIEPVPVVLVALFYNIKNAALVEAM